MEVFGASLGLRYKGQTNAPAVSANVRLCFCGLLGRLTRSAMRNDLQVC